MASKVSRRAAGSSAGSSAGRPARRAEAARSGRVGILTNGGDCPGLNIGVLAASEAVRAAGGEPVLLRGGYSALTAAASLPFDRLTELEMRPDPVELRSWARQGGSFLGSSRTNLGRDETYRTALSGLERLGISRLVIFGGDGTLTSAARLAADGLVVGAAPKTIDNDVAASELAIGFDTAVSEGVRLMDRLWDTARSHSRPLAMETMGRRSGFLAAAVARAGLADLLAVPEAPWTLGRLAERLAAGGPRLVVVAEGAWPEELLAGLPRSGSGRPPLGGVAQAAASHPTLADVKLAAVQPGHALRGGDPTAADRLLAWRLGQLAGAAAASSGGLAAVRAGEPRLAPVADAAAGRRHLGRSELAGLSDLLVD